MTFASKEKWRISIAFLVQETGGIPRIGWVIKTLEAQLSQFLLVCKCPVSRGNVQQQDPLCDHPAAFFLQKCLICTRRDE
jgi:hypothetical protein